MRVITKLLLIISLFQGLTFVADIQAIPVNVKTQKDHDLMLMDYGFARINLNTFAHVGGTITETPPHYLPSQRGMVLWLSSMPVTFDMINDYLVVSIQQTPSGNYYKVLRIMRLTDKDIKNALAGKTLVVSREGQYWIDSTPVAPKIKVQTTEEYIKKVNKITNHQQMAALNENINTLVKNAKDIPPTGLERNVAYARSREDIKPHVEDIQKILMSEITKRLGLITLK